MSFSIGKWFPSSIPLHFKKAYICFKHAVIDNKRNCKHVFHLFRRKFAKCKLFLPTVISRACVARRGSDVNKLRKEVAAEKSQRCSIPFEKNAY